ncbi:MAG TPA: anhydro-N-acetylmuramic acid kinase [Facklamia tabacinasalis]|nr:anhydro-N-acetylmuramic acid kinase [Ruoffia tabacinasalis]
MLSVGIMSGTSLDGIDVALCEILGSGTNTSVRLIEFDTYDLPQAIQEKVRQCAANEFIRPATMSSLNFKLGELFADGVKQICQKAGISNSIFSKNISFN